MRKKGCMYMGIMQNTWTTENGRLSVRRGRATQPASPTSRNLVLTGPPRPFAFPICLHIWLKTFWLPYYPTPYWASILIGPIFLTSYGALGPILPLTPHLPGPQSCQRFAGSLTTGKSTEHQLEGHQHITQMVGLWYDLHAAVLGVIEDSCTLQVRVAQLRIANVSNVQEPVPHVAQGPGWGQCWGS